jgi:hypothetical protein
VQCPGKRGPILGGGKRAGNHDNEQEVLHVSSLSERGSLERMGAVAKDRLQQDKRPAKSRTDCRSNSLNRSVNGLTDSLGALTQGEHQI